MTRKHGQERPVSRFPPNANVEVGWRFQGPVAPPNGFPTLSINEA